MHLSRKNVDEFREEVWEYYRHHGRSMPWREDPSPYKVLVSELMLQQTQVARVIPKFDAFMYTCPDIASLAGKSLGEVLVLWSGLGYNRRAKYLHQTARLVMSEFAGSLPDTFEKLVTLPGVGKNTAGAILAYAYNQPAAFIETNIRTVYFHHFYTHVSDNITDKELLALVEQTLDTENPRQWYWALMDYGTHLKRTAGGRLSSSKHYIKQPKLSGSLREMRGRIINKLVDGPQTKSKLYKLTDGDDRFERALGDLVQEGLVDQQTNILRLTGTPETS